MIATFVSPPAASSAASTSSPGSAGRLAHDAPDALAQLLVRRHDTDHQAFIRLAEANHRDRGDRVQDELLRGSRLQPRRAREDLRADDDGDLARAEAREVGSRNAHDAGGEGARRRCGSRRSEGERRAAARAHDDDRVVPPGTEGFERSRTGRRVVLRGLALLGRARSRARDDRERRGKARRTSPRTRRRRARRAAPRFPRPRRRAGRPGGAGRPRRPRPR